VGTGLRPVQAEQSSARFCVLGTKFMQLTFRQLSGSFAVCRLAPGAPIPALTATALFTSITRTAEELSIVCPADQAPQNAKCESPWTCFKLEGPFPFSLTGVLASFLDPLAERGVPIFAISTFDTDYVLIKEEYAATALEILESAGHDLVF
jgi:uncharacterized protein